jgi:hypothetical protein
MNSSFKTGLRGLIKSVLTPQVNSNEAVPLSAQKKACDFVLEICALRIPYLEATHPRAPPIPASSLQGLASAPSL